MEKLPHRAIYYDADIPAHSKPRVVKKEYQQGFRKAARLGRNGIIFMAAILGMRASYDYVAHANGEKGLTQGGTYAVVPHGDCATVGFVASHAVSHGEEDVNVLISANGQPDVTFALSGSPIKIGVATVCFDNGLVDTNLSIRGINGGIEGKEEIIYTHPGAQASE